MNTPIDQNDQLTCPIDGTLFKSFDLRHENLLCTSCKGRAVDSTGNGVRFFNQDMSGGIMAQHTRQDGTTFDDDNIECFVDGKLCHGVEFHMGGTGVILVATA